jgi:hypothetical protein
MGTSKAITARVAHFCSFCQMRASESATPVVQPGHRYLRHVGFPGEEGVGGDRPWVLVECISCATDKDDFAPVQAGACGTFCCGVTPCSLPFQKGAPSHNHACAICVILGAPLPNGGAR